MAPKQKPKEDNDGPPTTQELVEAYSGLTLAELSQHILAAAKALQKKQK